jgi:hypothetical protein
MKQEEFIEVLKEEGYSYEIEGDKLVVDLHNNYLGNIHLDIESIPPNVMFRNRGSLYLSELKSIPSGVEFRNTDGVHLKSVKSLSPDVEFRNGGIVRLKGIDDLPPGVEFNNGDYVYFNNLKSIPPGVVFNNGGDVHLNALIGEWIFEWEGNIEGIDSNRLLNVMINKGIFER